MESQPKNPKFRINPENFTHVIVTQWQVSASGTKVLYFLHRGQFYPVYTK